jgi:UMF1 family MFS transporter
MFKDLFRKETFSWALYDWANSAFSTSIIAGFFPIFFKSYWNQGVDAATSTARLGFTNAIASFVIAVLAPFLGALADEAGAKKKFLFWGVLLGSLATLAFAVIGEGGWMWASGCYVFTLIAFAVTVCSTMRCCRVCRNLRTSISFRREATHSDTSAEACSCF